MGRYDEWIEKYETIPLGDIPWETGKPKDVVVDFFRDKRAKALINGKPVLDICSGAGSNTAFIAKEGFSVVGVDIAPRAAEYSLIKAREEGVTIPFVIADVTWMPFKSESFDIALDMGCFHSLLAEDRERYIAGLKRVIAKGGLYHITCFSNKNKDIPWNNFSEEEIRAYFSNDFNILEVSHYSRENNLGNSRLFHTFLMVKL